MQGDARSSWDDIGKLVLRCLVGVLLLFHGIAKVQRGVAWMAGPLAAFHLPAFISYGVYVGEVLAPILLILGLLTRPAALVLSFDLVVAVILVAYHRFFTLSQSGGWALESEAFYLFLGLVIFFLGPGAYSLSRGRGPWWR